MRPPTLGEQGNDQQHPREEVGGSRNLRSGDSLVAREQRVPERRARPERRDTGQQLEVDVGATVRTAWLFYPQCNCVMETPQ